MITHACAHFWGEQNIRYRHFLPGEVDYVFLPLFHANALLLGVTSALMAGTTVALARRFSTSRFWSDVRTAGATRFNAIGAVGNFLYSQPPTRATATTRCGCARWRRRRRSCTTSSAASASRCSTAMR